MKNTSQAKALWVLILPFFMAACTPLPEVRDVPLEFEVPDSWRAQPNNAEGLGDGLISDRWWEQFNEPTLNRLVEKALENSPSLHAAVARVEAARAVARIAGASDRPQVSLDAAANRQKLQFGLPTGTAAFRRTNHTLGLNVSWELDLWGRLRAGEEAALADAEAAEATFYGIRQSLIGSVVRTYFRVVDLEHQVTIAEDESGSARELYDRVESRFQSGLRTALDVTRARAEVDRSEARFTARRAQLESARRQLETLLGDYPSGELEAAEQITVDALPVPAGLPSTLISRRPDLAEAERQVRAADLRLHEAEADLLPRFALTASGGTSAEQLNDILDRDFSVWSLAGNLTQPIFQGGRIDAQIDRAQAGVNESLARFVETALAAYAEVENALVQEPLLRAREEALTRAATTSRESLELSQERYFGGLLDIIDVLDTQRRTFEAESALSLVKLSRIENRLDLVLALGGGFERPDEWSKPSERKRRSAAETEAQQ